MTTLSPRLASRAQVGLHAPLVHVEVHLASGLPMFSIVGMAATAVKESKDRVRAALLNSGFEFPAGRITVNLAPADVPKEGGRFDLPIALGILLASGQLALPAGEGEAALSRSEFYGELALNGELKSIRGVLLAAVHARQAAHDLIVPQENLGEARIATRGYACGARHLLDVCGHLSGVSRLASDGASAPFLAEIASSSKGLDLSDVHGQLQAKRALMVAAAGAHSLLMLGPPGSGKSMLAQRLPGLLPPLTEQEALEVATIASVSTSGFDARTFGQRPLRAPHHSASFHAIVGGGRQVSPGEVSLAHRGVLFLDELPEFDRRALEALREPLEAGVINISRVAMRAEYPAAFQLVAAMNPCPCGYLGDPSGRCNCPVTRIASYRGRISGPLLDRIDLRIEVPAVPESALTDSAACGESSAAVAARVREARSRQLARCGLLNSQLSVKALGEHCRLDAAGRRLLWRSREKLGMSVRSYHRTLRVARTIADLEGSEGIRVAHVGEALQLKRTLE
jgi:magnesium chelatase family protein